MPTAPTALIESARRAPGPVGAFLPVQMTSAPPVDPQRDAVRRMERAGYRTAWTNEAVEGKAAARPGQASGRPGEIGRRAGHFGGRCPVSEQLAVGADHVIFGLPLGSDFASGVDHVVGLAPAVVEGQST